MTARARVANGIFALTGGVIDVLAYLEQGPLVGEASCDSSRDGKGE